ncbi:MAG: hypothetical protein JW958_14430 [Candidatus Eisenbacteria bacterium]|nr:hypothetical protein [Candidatus Eisenbacteria bacterium]
MSGKEAIDETGRERVARFFSGRGDVAAVYTFPAPHCRRRDRDESVDLGVLLHPLVEQSRYDDKRIEIAQALAVDLATPHVRVVILNDASPNFCYDLIRQGKVLFFGATDILRAFENRIQAEFLRGVHGRRENAGPVGAR